MNILKSAILTASILGIISTIVDFTVPGDSLKKQLKLIITMTLILGLFTPFLGSGFKINLQGAESLLGDPRFGEINRSFEDHYLSQTEHSIERQLRSELEKESIYSEKIRIHCSLDEYNVIEIIGAEIYLSDAADISQAEQIVKALLPECDRITVSEVSGEAG